MVLQSEEDQQLKDQLEMLVERLKASSATISVIKSNPCR